MAKTNTKISYLYRDACNYKQFQDVIVSGKFTDKQVNDIQDNILDGVNFIPEQVGLPEIRFGEITEDDHCWFELLDFTETKDEPTIDMSAKSLYGKFLEVKKTGWDDVKYAPCY